MSQQNDQRLFEYIDSIGPVMNYKGSLSIYDNTGKFAQGGKTYTCFIKGGIQFEISKEFFGPTSWEYYFNDIWEGPFDAATSTDIIATLLWLKHQVPELVDE